MESVLKSRWLEGIGERVEMLDQASVAVLRDLVRARGAELGLPERVTAALVNVASELGRNQLAHARRGEIGLLTCERDGARGMEIVAADEGPGLDDPARALAGAPRAHGSLGVGLAATLELADEVDFDVRCGEGTCVRARKFAGEVARAPVYGVFGRPIAEEWISGDDAFAARDGAELFVAIADGLGHGEPAREASSAAMAAATPARDLPAILERCHAHLTSTRGVVMAVARVGARVELACAGNIAIQLYGGPRSVHLIGPSSVLGMPGPRRKPLVLSEPFERGALVLFTDGVSSHADLEGDHDLLREHPIVIAQRVIERFSRSNDDALVLVVR